MNIKKLIRSEVAFLMDATLLKPITTQREIEKLCQDALQYNIQTVCIPPCYVLDVREVYFKKSTRVKICTVVGFPLGYNSRYTKEYEARRAINDGANEIDFCLDISAVKSGEWDYIEGTINIMRDICRVNTLKIILETGYLSEDEIIHCCEIALAKGVDFVKTSTGFGPRGATVEDIKLMKKVVGEHVGIKAAGGIKTYEDFLKMIDAGATRVGCSSYLEILSQAPEEPEVAEKVAEAPKKKKVQKRLETIKDENKIDAEVVVEADGEDLPSKGASK